MNPWMRGAMVWASLLGSSGAAQATQLLELSGLVALADGTQPTGVTVTLGVDLNRDGKISSFERLRGTVDTSGNYRISYDLEPQDVDLEFIVFAAALIAAYNERGFAALLDDGPLPIVVSFEREGYTTITRTLSTLLDQLEVDAWLIPLQDIRCTDTGCETPDGGVRISGFPGGTRIARAYAEAYDPTRSPDIFPGSFSDADDNLLLSTGFVEVDLRDAAGRRVTELSKEVEVRYEAHRDSWSTMRDLQPENGRIDVPMYSFDELQGQWVAERNGTLENAAGAPLAESELPAVQSGTYPGPLFIRFETKHFSWFNCDYPVDKRACVKGRVVDDEGTPVDFPVTVSVHGVNYRGTAGSMRTSAGYFASDLMKSEEPDEDVDRNGERGQTFTAQVQVTAAMGRQVSAAFDSPRTPGTVGRGRASCAPQDCECLDLGDIPVAIQRPRACRITIRATYSGTSRRGESPFTAGDPIAGVGVRGTLVGYPPLMRSIAEICGSGECAASTNADGMATFIVPVTGEAPQIDLKAYVSVKQDDEWRSYTGKVELEGCAQGVAELDTVVELRLDHVAQEDMGEFIASLGSGPSANNESRLPGPRHEDCGCRFVGRGGHTASFWLVLAGASALWMRRRRRLATLQIPK